MEGEWVNFGYVEYWKRGKGEGVEVYENEDEWDYCNIGCGMVSGVVIICEIKDYDE